MGSRFNRCGGLLESLDKKKYEERKETKDTPGNHGKKLEAFNTVLRTSFHRFT
jgi:hypothetical protein